MRTDNRSRPSRNRSRPLRRYYLTPRVWNRTCSHCGHFGSIAYRHTPRAYACRSCIEALGIKPQESKAWREGGARAGAAVTIRHVDPATLRSDGSRPQNRW